MLDFDIQVHQTGRYTVLSVAGDLDVLTAATVRERLLELIESGHINLLIDLRPTEFLDSSGLSALVSGVKRVRVQGGDLALICPPGNVRRLIEVVALDQVFTLYDSPEAVPA